MSAHVLSCNPLFAQLVFEQHPASYPAVLFADRLDLHYDEPQRHAIEPDAVHDPVRVPQLLGIGERAAVSG